MGKARRRRWAKKKVGEKDDSSIYKDEDLNILEELRAAGLPCCFESTKGKHVDGQPNTEAARVGQLRRSQQVQGKKLKQWQIRRLKGAKLRQRKMK